MARVRSDSLLPDYSRLYWGWYSSPSPQGWLSAVLFVTLAGLVLLSPGRVGPWLGVALVFYVVTLGPFGQSHALPMGWLLRLLPDGFLHYVRPFRAFPAMWLGLVVAWVVGLEGLVERLRTRVRLEALLTVLLPLVLAGAVLTELGVHGALRLTTTPFALPMPLAEIAALPGDFAILELPYGVEQQRLFQPLHKKRRFGSFKDEISSVVSHLPPPVYHRSEFTAWLWNLHDSHSAPAPLPRAAITSAVAEGFRFVVLYDDEVRSVTDRGVPFDLGLVRSRLDEALGPPTWNDGQVQAWDLTSAP